MIGEVVNYRYEVLEKCGDGSFFAVFKARDKVLNRLVAVKVLLPQFAANHEFAERVIAEAQAVSALNHPNTVRIYEADKHEGTYFIATEYIRGMKLKDKIRRLAPFSPGQAVDLAIAIAEALDDSHQHAIVHGDVRPQNVIVTSDSQARVTDFGMAAAVSSFPRVQTSASLRSIHYTAPEVAEGKVPRPASDIYSLGVTLYEMLTGTVPFDGDTPIAVALRHAKDPPPSPRALNATIPRALEAIVLKCLQKLPEDRYRNMQELLQDLRTAREAIAASPVPFVPEPDERVAPVIPEREVVVKDEGPTMLGRLVKWGFVFFGAAIVFGIAVFLFFVVSNPGEGQVPPLLGKTEVEAQALVQQAGLEMLVVERTFDDKYAGGQVKSMYPEAGMHIKKGKTVKVWVSRGPRFTTVPDVSQIPEDRARKQILDAGLVVGEIMQEYDDKVPAGSVTKQRPAAGTQSDRGRPVTLFLSLGKKQEEPPTVEPEETQNQDGPQRSFSVGITVPADGPDTQIVKIVVADEYGENTAYEQEHHPGDKVKEVVTGTGRPITIRVYLDENLISEQTK